MTGLNRTDGGDGTRPAAKTIHRGFGAPLRSLLGRDWTLAWLFLAPATLIVLGLIAYPAVSAFLLSFQSRFLGQVVGQWVGLRNYAKLLGKGSLYLSAAWMTVKYTAIAVGAKFVLGLLGASILNQNFRGRNFWRGILFIPWAVPGAVAAYAWRFVYDPAGFFNTLILLTGIREEYIYFLADERLAFWSVMVVAIWSGAPFYMMNFLAGMQSIPAELYEAAEIDGAGVLQRFWHVTLAGLRPVILIVLLVSIIGTSGQLNPIYILTAGGPNNATLTLPMFSYRQAFSSRLLGYGAAISVTMMPFYMLLVIVLTRWMLRQD
jgi:ABC-type sugar transport system permease subunit